MSEIYKLNNNYEEAEFTNRNVHVTIRIQRKRRIKRNN